MAETILAARPGPAERLRRYLRLTKPRVNTLIVFCAVIGMFLAAPGMVPLQALFAGTLGIALVAGAAAAMNCLIEQEIDAVMARTQGRPLPRGEVNSLETLMLSGLIGGLGLALLFFYVNPFTMWLTLATFVGYAIVYTVILKPRTPQNIVIGGASGAMPPVLGWAAVTGDAPGEAWLLFLIIFVWTPPHFWSLALYRAHEYADAKLPMLPVVYGREYTLRCIFAYTLGLSRGDADALRHRHERLALPRRGAGPRRHLHRPRLAPAAPLQRPRRAGQLPLVDHLPVPAVRRAAGGPLPSLLT